MSESLYVYMSAGVVYLRRRAGYFSRAPIEEVGQWNWNISNLSSLTLPIFNDIKRSKRSNIHVRVGSGLCKFMVTDLPDGVVGNEYSAVAAAQISHKLGLNSTEWTYSSEIDHVNRKLFVCALRRVVAERIKTLATEHELKLLSIKPFATALWNEFAMTVNRAEYSQISLIAVEEDSLTLFNAKNGILQSMNSFFHRQEPDLVNREVRRLRLSSGTEQYIGIALPEKLYHLAADHQEKVLRNPDRALQARRADFSDLMLSIKSETALNEQT